MRASVWVTDAKANGKGRLFAFERVVVAIDLDLDIVAPVSELVVEKPREGLGRTAPFWDPSEPAYRLSSLGCA